MNKRPTPFVIPFFIPHAGCPHRCVFCNQNAITGITAPPSPADIRPAIHRFRCYNHRRRKPVQLAFYGGNFLGLAPDAIIGLLTEAQECVREGLIDQIRFSTRPDTITTRALVMIAGFSVRTIELGIQSMDDAVLSLSRRGHTAGQCEQALRLLKERGYETGAQIMTGLPGDTGPQSMDTAEKLAVLGPDFVRIYPAVVISGSPLATWYQNGEYTPPGLRDTVHLVSGLYRIFESCDIPVIRMGLQPTEELDNSAVVLAGPYHPAFGHLVRSTLFLEKAVRVIADSPPCPDRSLTLYVHPRSVPVLRGLHNDNIQSMKDAFGLKTIRIRGDSTLAPDQIVCREKQSDHA